MQKSYIQVEDEFKRYKALDPENPITLSEFAKAADETEGQLSRQSAYETGVLKSLSGLVDRGFRITGLPQAGRVVGRSFGELLNMDPENVDVLASIGEGTPRMATEGMLTLVNPTTAIPKAAAYGARALGYGSTFARGTAETDSLLGGAVSAGQMVAANTLVPKLGAKVFDKTQGFLNRNIPPVDLPSPTTPGVSSEVLKAGLQPSSLMQVAPALPVAARLATEVGVGVPLNELTRQLQLSASGVPLLDEQRNPFTEQNILANVAGVAAFTPMYAHSLMTAPKANIQSVESLARWEAERSKFLDTQTWEQTPGGRKPAADPALAESGKIPLFLETAMENYRLAESEGRTADAQQAKDSVSRLLRASPQRDLQTLSEMTGDLDVIVRNAAPDTPAAWDTFIGEYNAIVKQYNDNITAENVVKTPETVGKTWHPSARSPEVIKQLQEGGYLPEITPEYLAKQYNFFLDRSIGDPEFASRAVAQKVVNDLFDGIDDAIQRRGAEDKVNVEPTRRQKLLQERELKAEEEYQQSLYTDAFLALPKEVQTEVYKRHVQFQEMLDKGRGDKGLYSVTYYPGWRDLVIQAMQTYDPKTDTFKYRKPVRVADSKTGKSQIARDLGGQIRYNLQTHRLSDLWAKNSKGEYVLTPEPKTIKAAEGGKIKGGETSLDAPVGEKQTGYDNLDEAVFWTEKAEGKYADDPDRRATSYVEPNADPGFVQPEMSPEEISRLEVLGSQLREQFKTIQNNEIWALVKDLYVQRSPSGMEIANSMNSFRSRNMKLALQAKMEEGWSQRAGRQEQLREVGKAGREFLDLLRARGAYKYDEAKTPRENLRAGLKMFFSVGNRVSETDALQQIMSKVLAPKDLESLRKGPAFMRAGIEPPTGFQETGELVSTKEPTNSLGNAGDAYTTMRYFFHKELGKQGYSGSMREWMTDVAAAVAVKVGQRNVDIYNFGSSDAQGVAYPDFVTRVGKVGVNFKNKGDATAFVIDTVRTTLHELAHIDDFIRAGLVLDSDVYSQQQKRLHDNLVELDANLTPEERDVILTTMRDGLFPMSLRGSLQATESGTSMMYGARTQHPAYKTTEFRAQVRSMVETALLLGVEKKKIDMDNLFNYTPTEVQEYARGQFRQIGDVLDALRQHVTYKNGNSFVGEAMDMAVQTARSLSEYRQPDVARAQARQLIANLDPGAAGAVQLPTAGQMIMRDRISSLYEVSPAQMKSATEAIESARKLLIADPTEKGARPAFFQKFFPFYNLMHSMERAGVPLARDVWNLATAITPSIHRKESALLAPLLTKNAQGRYEFDKSNPLLQRIQKEPNGKWRVVLNKLRKYQNEEGYKPYFVQGENGLITPTKEGQKHWDAVRKLLSPEDQQVVMNGMVAMDQIYQKSSEFLTAGLFDRIKYRVAATLMARNRDMSYEQAQGLAGEILVGDPATLGTKVPPEQLQPLMELLSGPNGLLGKFEEVKKHLQSRKGFSSEQLPHDWIIQFKNSEGKTKFISAETEKAAIRLAQKLQVEGNTITSEIVNKRDVGKYSQFDDPSEVLTKFIEQEQAVYENFINRLETAEPELAQRLRDEYTPGIAAEKELQRQGLKKFMLENEGKVDTTRLDYLEAMSAYVGKLSASLAFREVREQLNLIMNDPRGRPYKTFKQQVQDHFNFIFSPTPAALTEWKSMLSGYYLGANLSSAFVEGTQSFVTLVPTLINLGKGGIGSAYRQMWDGVQDMVQFGKSDWQKTAREAKMLQKLGRKLTPEQERIVAYERAVEDGLIDHGVIQDLEYGRDQRLLLTARLGRGEFSDLSMGQMLKDKAYVGSQMMMRMYSWMAIGNTKLAFLSGLRHGQELGLTGNALYNHARQVKDLATFGGGKSNIPTYVSQWSSPYTRNAFVMMHTLQQYGMGMFATYAQMAKDSIGKTLPPGQRLQARKALGTMLITQTAIAGTLGLPFAAAALTMLEKTFGIEANRAVREGLASLAGRDEDGNITEAGAILADSVLNGAGNQLFGIDLSARAGVSNLFGTSAYRGFNLVDMLGPLPGVVENMYSALQNFGQGEPMKAAKSLVPQAFKNAVELSETKAKYGDTAFRDKSGDMLFQPSQSQLAAYMIGFRPRELSAKRQAQQMMVVSEDNAQKKRQEIINKAATAILRGDANTAQKIVADTVRETPGQKYDELMRAVVNQSVEMRVPKDITRTGVAANADNRTAIAESFGPEVVPQMSETQRTMLAAQTAQAVGRPQLIGVDQIRRAKLIDQLTRNRRMSRSQAIRLLEMSGN